MKRPDPSTRGMKAYVASEPYLHGLKPLLAAAWCWDGGLGRGGGGELVGVDGAG